MIELARGPELMHWRERLRIGPKPGRRVGAAGGSCRNMAWGRFGRRGLQVLPEEAWRSLYRDVADAVNLAVIGEPAAGVTVLDCGFRLARDGEAENGWGVELVRQYRLALDGYCAEYGIHLEAPASGGSPLLEPATDAVG